MTFIHFTLVTTLFFSLNASAQNDTSKLSQSKEKLINAVCDCISKTDTNSVNNNNDAERMLTKCVTDNLDMLIGYAQEKTKKDISNLTEEDLKSVSKEVAALVYSNCPAMAAMVHRVKSKNK
ncbi:hypothetical protein [Ferruginibacter albus]|uniref:hypothetical protein n=1 Tax=Ferruginibacter albus TaxID=2875540 RepID=UPI001CC7722A|nr:hypothetical protein [Ferruginibacter albus]UAY52479.1 hypothetical protein K9M53_02025 [Ferruginibacter albus]